MAHLRPWLVPAVLSVSISMLGCAASHRVELATPTPIARPAPLPHVTPPAQIDRAALRAQLAARRRATFDAFIAYRERRVYPVNNVPGSGMRHVWLDPQGNLCAAATLVSHDWGRAAAIRAGAANNEQKLADVTAGPLADWMLTSGLTHHELVAIQVPGFDWEPEERPADPRAVEIARLYGIYIDVERQLESLWDENLDEAVDALVKRPELARAMLSGVAAGPGVYGDPVASSTPNPTPTATPTPASRGS